MKSRMAARTKSDRPANPRSFVRPSICCTSESGSETDMIDIRFVKPTYQLIIRLSSYLFDSTPEVTVVKNQALRVLIRTLCEIDSFTEYLNNRDRFRRGEGHGATRPANDHRDHRGLPQPRGGRGRLFRPATGRYHRATGGGQFLPVSVLHLARRGRSILGRGPRPAGRRAPRLGADPWGCGADGQLRRVRVQRIPRTLPPEFLRGPPAEPTRPDQRVRGPRRVARWRGRRRGDRSAPLVGPGVRRNDGDNGRRRSRAGGPRRKRDVPRERGPACPGPRGAERNVRIRARALRPPGVHHATRGVRLPREAIQPNAVCDPRPLPGPGADPCADPADPQRDQPDRVQVHLLRGTREPGGGSGPRPGGARPDDGAQPHRRPERDRVAERGHIHHAHGNEPREPSHGAGVHMSATARPQAPVVSYDGPVVAVRNVDLDRDGQAVLRDINFVVEKGQILGVVGPNGGGKTSLLRLVLGLERPTRGEIELFGQPVARFRGWNRIGYIPQHAVGFDQNFPASVRGIVLLGRVARRGLLRWLGTEDRNAARRAIELCGLIGLEGRRVGALSGGEKQRVFIAKAIAAEPDLLVTDEPTAGVDPESERRFYDLLGRLKDELGLTVIFVSPDLGGVSARVDRVAGLNPTPVYEGPPRALRGEELVRRLYGGRVVTVAADQDQPHTHGH